MGGGGVGATAVMPLVGVATSALLQEILAKSSPAIARVTASPFGHMVSPLQRLWTSYSFHRTGHPLQANGTPARGFLAFMSLVYRGFWCIAAGLDIAVAIRIPGVGRLVYNCISLPPRDLARRFNDLVRPFLFCPPFDSGRAVASGRFHRSPDNADRGLWGGTDGHSDGIADGYNSLCYCNGHRAA